MGSHPTFSQRLATRNELWWTRRRWTDWRAYPGLLHRFLELRAVRSQHDPDDVWRCCALWQRTLLDKWNSREFVSRHGCPVPELYWAGAELADAPFESLPRDFVIRPVLGAAQRGVLVVADGWDLMRNRAAPLAELRRRRPWPRPLGRRPRFLIEELVEPEDGSRSLPLEYKCHTFGDTVAAIQVIARTGPAAGRHRLYTPEWTPFPEPLRRGEEDDLRAPPRCLPQILELAARLGVAFGTYAWIDFFATDRGCLFNEFSSMPTLGSKVTPYADEWFGALWAEKLPHAT
jgi:hypothetical protein